LRLPGIGSLLGQRRSWILLCQIALAIAIIAMGLAEPRIAPLTLAALALAVAVISATQDIAIDAYRIEILDEAQYGAGSAAAIYGWHLGAFASGAGVLYVATFGGWTVAYGVVGACMLALTAATLLVREPEREAAETGSGVFAVLYGAAIAPLVDFFARYRGMALMILLLIVLYKFGDAMLGRMAGVFYVDLAFSKIDIANYAKTLGLIGLLLGVFAGGVMCARFGIMRALLFGAVLMMLTNLLFAGLAATGKNYPMLATAVFFDNLTAGMGTSAFVAYLSSLCNIAYTATQYALLASLGNLARIQLSLGAGWVVDSLGGNWAVFFILTAAAALPGLILLVWMMRRFPQRADPA
jgi:PAT family beta-lactamase induction signal transducer AmpG